jgi:predicted MFS family arabinose efflux permease
VRHRAAEAKASDSAWGTIFGGARVVFSNPRLRSILLVVWLSPAMGFAWEGIAAPWASEMHHGARIVGVLLAAGAGGMVIGSIVISRLLTERLRHRLVLPLAVLAPGLLGFTLLAGHNVAASIVLVVLTGACGAFNIPLNSVFMQSLPTELRGRGFGVAQGGLMASQGLGVLAAGALAGAVRPSVAIAVLGLIGAALTLIIGRLQPMRLDS